MKDVSAPRFLSGKLFVVSLHGKSSGRRLGLACFDGICEREHHQLFHLRWLEFLFRSHFAVLKNLSIFENDVSFTNLDIILGIGGIGLEDDVGNGTDVSDVFKDGDA